MTAVGRAMHGADRRQFVHDSCQPRQMLADLNAGYIGRDWLKVAADFGWRVGFEIKHVLMRRCATQVNHDDRLFRLSNSLLCFSPQNVRKGQPSNPQCANGQDLTAGQTVAEALLRSKNRQHVRSPRAGSVSGQKQAGNLSLSIHRCENYCSRSAVLASVAGDLPSLSGAPTIHAEGRHSKDFRAGRQWAGLLSAEWSWR